MSNNFAYITKKMPLYTTKNKGFMMLITDILVKKKMLLAIFCVFVSSISTTVMISNKVRAQTTNLILENSTVCSPTQSQQDCQQEMKIKFGRQTIFVPKPINESTR
ncbi:hypothetical protein NIES4071_06210 [Calothrix sp. NIES-4071]|nr:hypothetical protein NIES4071_06210 [Calothrix sp. NIES-4071]BAZ54964.1 hypothetical protein NIES4105_06180 [Calothrix sp. NIES-4105]